MVAGWVREFRIINFSELLKTIPARYFLFNEPTCMGFFPEVFNDRGFQTLIRIHEILCRIIST